MVISKINGGKMNDYENLESSCLKFAHIWNVLTELYSGGHMNETTNDLENLMSDVIREIHEISGDIIDCIECEKCGF